jgi:hypothetical protein
MIRRTTIRIMVRSVGIIQTSMIPQNTVIDHPPPGSTVNVLAYTRKYRPHEGQASAKFEHRCWQSGQAKRPPVAMTFSVPLVFIGEAP